MNLLNGSQLGQERQCVQVTEVEVLMNNNFIRISVSHLSKGSPHISWGHSFKCVKKALFDLFFKIATLVGVEGDLSGACKCC